MGNTSNASSIYPGRMSAKDRRLLKMILVIFVWFVVCYLPITVSKIWKSANDVHVFNIMGYLLIYLTTCINPLIYVLMSSEYRRAYWNLLRCHQTEKQQQHQRAMKKHLESNRAAKTWSVYKSSACEFRPSRPDSKGSCTHIHIHKAARYSNQRHHLYSILNEDRNFL